jgi:hypothetical protein
MNTLRLSSTRCHFRSSPSAPSPSSSNLVIHLYLKSPNTMEVCVADASGGDMSEAERLLELVVVPSDGEATLSAESRNFRKKAEWIFNRTERT